MTLCNIVGCGHRIRTGHRNHSSSSWIDYEICPCCAVELEKSGVIKHRFSYRASPACISAINKELEKIHL